MPLTDADKSKLAVFAGGKRGQRYEMFPTRPPDTADGTWNNPVWLFPSGEHVDVADWSPAEKVEHTWMVWEALVKNVGWWYFQEKCRWAIKRVGLPDAYNLDWLKDVICNVALEIIKQEGAK